MGHRFTPKSMDSAAEVNSPMRMPPTTVAMVMATMIVSTHSVVEDPASTVTVRVGASRVRARLQAWRRTLFTLELLLQTQKPAITWASAT